MLTRWLGLLLLAATLTGCASGGQQSLRQGLLRLDIGQTAFLREWGTPDRTQSVLSESQLVERWRGGFGSYGGFVRGDRFEGRKPLDLWIYERYGTELVFDDGDLVAWHTTKSVQELREHAAGKDRQWPF
jgi:hypothetical protein